MAIPSVILAADVGELAQLPGGEHPVGDRNPKHRGMLLDVEPVLQPQRPELVLGQLAREKAARLVAELRDAFVDELLVKGVVAIHGPNALDRSVPNRLYV